uniref:Uncharacterized protein n=1 Tax=Oryza brachyantha TaxID=4533 RepID=J3N2B7_ORYBR
MSMSQHLSPSIRQTNVASWIGMTIWVRVQGTRQFVVFVAIFYYEQYVVFVELFMCDVILYYERPDGYPIPARYPMGMGIIFYPRVWVRVENSTHKLRVGGQWMNSMWDEKKQRWEGRKLRVLKMTNPLPLKVNQLHQKQEQLQPKKQILENELRIQKLATKQLLLKIESSPKQAQRITRRRLALEVGQGSSETTQPVEMQAPVQPTKKLTPRKKLAL